MRRQSMDRVCIIEDCGKIHFARSYCKNHYEYGQRHGWEMPTSQREHRGYVDKGYYIKIPLGIGATRGYALVDKENVSLGMLNWNINAHGYAVSHKNNVVILMHHAVIGKPSRGKVVDHINRNRVDNRRNNLRITTYSINARNIDLSKANTSGITGVAYRPEHDRWVAHLTINRKIISSTHKTKEEAVIARKNLEIKYAGVE